MKKNPVSEKPVWNYDPKSAGKTTMVLGSDKPDYRKKDEVYKERTPTTLTSSRKKWFCTISLPTQSHSTIINLA